MKTKTFDCIEMKRKGSEALQKKLKTMSPEEQLEFWRKETESLVKMQAKLSAKNQ